MSNDPVGFATGGVAYFNRYAYVANNPVNNTDPTGMCSESSSESGLLCKVEDWISNAIEPVVEGAMKLAGVDVVPEEERDPNGEYSHTAEPQSARDEGAAIGAAIVAAGVGRIAPGKGGSRPPASAPAGRRMPNSESANRQLTTPEGPPRNEPAEVDGRPFSGHALDRMQDRGLVPSVVNNAVRPGNLVKTSDGASTYYDAVNGVSVIIDNASGRVITAY